ncbi:FecR domain-containing protein [Duganella sp. sic0402]|uniref:FecR family protein n=1 Tax=Duganella sp. sic0402 TaxID=2854786 RepID=UPI001C4974E0|nr:FecR domain-containing protein [Duganella sp. sic0402]MBV7537513.1 FecR domain-containing protein [Duganella sp. sic0402]
MSPRPLSDPSLSELDRQALDWFARRQRVFTPEEEREFDAWLRADPAHRQALQRWHADWTQLDALPADGIAQLRRRLTADLHAEQSASAHAVSPARRHWLMAMAPRAALAGVTLIAAGGGLLAWNEWRQQPLYAADFTTPRGQQQDITLPDGSVLRLDTDTRIAVQLYRERREVRLLQGQAVFQVRGDVQRPFDVLAGALRVTVVGTRFSVRHTPGVPGADGVQVEVEEGRVRVASASGAVETIELGAGQRVAADRAGRLGALGQVAAAGIAPWRDGRINFDNVPLEQVLAEFGRYGDTGLLIHDTAVAALRITGTFDPHRLDNFRRVLPGVLPVELHGDIGKTEIVARH